MKISEKITRTLGKSKFQLKKHGPEILVISGIVGLVTSGILACKATTKASKISEEHKNRMDQIHKVVELSNENEI